MRTKTTLMCVGYSLAAAVMHVTEHVDRRENFKTVVSTLSVIALSWVWVAWIREHFR